MSQTQVAPKSDIRPGLILPFALLVVIYLPVLRDLVFDWWHDDNYTHGFLVPVISSYLLWTWRDELAKLPRGEARAGLILLALSMLLFVVGTGAAEYFTARLSFIMALFSLVWFFWGKTIARRVWFAFFFLCFMIPLPYIIYYAIAAPMQLIASKVTVVGLDLIGLTVARQGNIIHIAGGITLEVAEACSGIRSLVALLAMGALFAFWTQKRTYAQLILFLGTIPIAVFANVVRVFLTALLAATVVENVTAEPWHSLMGLLVFVVSFIGMAICGVILRRVAK